MLQPYQLRIEIEPKTSQFIQMNGEKKVFFQHRRIGKDFSRDINRPTRSGFQMRISDADEAIFSSGKSADRDSGCDFHTERMQFVSVGKTTEFKGGKRAKMRALFFVHTPTLINYNLFSLSVASSFPPPAIADVKSRKI